MFLIKLIDCFLLLVRLSVSLVSFDSRVKLVEVGLGVLGEWGLMMIGLEEDDWMYNLDFIKNYNVSIVYYELLVISYWFLVDSI